MFIRCFNAWRHQIPRTKDSAAEFESSNATLAITAARRYRSHSCALDARQPPVPRTARCTLHNENGEERRKEREEKK